MYKFKGSMSEEDYIEYNIFHMNNSKSLQKTNFAIRFIFPVGFILFGILSKREFNSIFWTVLIVGTIMTFLWMPKLIDKSLKKRVSSMLKDGKNGDLFEENDYSFDESGIKVESVNTSNFYNWNSVTHIEESENTFYIYVSSIQAVIVPKKYIINITQIDEFRKFINSFI